MKEERCRVVENKNIDGKYYLMKIETATIAGDCKPGNFVMVSVSTAFDPLLKRPFGILKAAHPHIWLYFQVIGKGTAALSGFRENDYLAVLGPLGNSFPVLSGKNILLAAGGRGIAPLFFAAEHYRLQNTLFLVYGARTAGDLNLLDSIAALHLDKTYLYTADGSVGKKGMITNDIRSIIADNKIDITISCGPEAMFKNLQRELAGLGSENYVSLEAFMGCGFGICHSCVVKTSSGGYMKVCSAGPVARLEEIAC